MKEDISSSLKSTEIEDWADNNIARPLGYKWAKVFARWNVHPNAVTIVSMFVGAASAIFFLHGSIFYEGFQGLLFNALAVFILYIAYALDNADGQLARMTGKKSKLGRILDGSSGYTWYIPIYFALIYRFYLHHSIEFNFLGIEDNPTTSLIATIVVFCLAFISGYFCLASQQRTADYYIQIHLFFLKGEKGSELDSSAKQREMLDAIPSDRHIERLIQKIYIAYTTAQERRTPEFQKLMAKLTERYGSKSDAIPSAIHHKVRLESLKLMRYVFMLVFNFRTISLLIFCLLDIPVAHFLFEIIVISLIERYVIHRHESFCKEIADSLD